MYKKIKKHQNHFYESLEMGISTSDDFPCDFATVIYLN